MHYCFTLDDFAASRQKHPVILYHFRLCKNVSGSRSLERHGREKCRRESNIGVEAVLLRWEGAGSTGADGESDMTQIRQMPDTVPCSAVQINAPEQEAGGRFIMEKKNIDWSNLGFGYMVTDKRYVSMFKDGAWDEGALISDDKIVMSEDAGVLHYSQSIFEGLKAYTTQDGRIVCFRPDLNADRMYNSALRMEMPPFPRDRFIDSVVQTVRANAAWVPPYGTGATLYVRPLMFGISPVIGVKPAEEYMYRVFVTPVGPYFKGGATPIAIKVSEIGRAHV